MRASDAGVVGEDAAAAEAAVELDAAADADDDKEEEEDDDRDDDDNDDDFFFDDFFLPLPEVALRRKPALPPPVPPLPPPPAAAALLQKAHSRHLQYLQWLAAFSGLQKVPQAAYLKSPGILDEHAVRAALDAAGSSDASVAARRKRSGRIVVCVRVRGSASADYSRARR